MDLPADFYLQTIDRVFHRRDLAEGTFVSRGRQVDPGAITRTAILTVEGEKDDICAIGQTAAAHALLTGLPPAKQQHYLQPRVGHYGVFNGKHWRNQIYPMVRDFITKNG
jgi:poly(3-hydroxybutyrate) depolymerase